MMLGFDRILILLTMLAGLVLPNPIGVPPLPEDPRLLGCAPADSLAYVQWFGTAEAHPRSPNQTEQLAAEPEVRSFVAAIVDLLAGASSGLTARGVPELVGFLLRRPGCAFVTTEEDSPMPTGYGLVVDLGTQAESVAARVGEIIGSMQSSDARRTVEGVEYHILEAGGVDAGWAVHDGHLVFAYGPKSMRSAALGFANAHGLADNPRFAAARRHVAVARPSLRTFVDVGVLFELLGRVERDAPAVLAALGFDSIQAYCAESGLEGEGHVVRALLSTGERRGLLALFDGEVLTPSTLALVPADATLAGVARLDAARALRLVFDAFDEIEPRDARAAERWIDESVDRLFDLDLRDDLLAHLGDEWAVWSSPSEGSVLMLGACACVTLDDAAAFKKSFDQLVTRLDAMLPDGESGRHGAFVSLEVLDHEGSRIHWLDVADGDLPFAPAFCVHGGKFWFATFPQVLKAANSRPAGAPTLADISELPADAAWHIHVDARSLLTTCYAPLLMLARAATAELRQEGLRVDFAAVPRLGSIAAHLGAETISLENHEAGLRVTSRGTIPHADPALALAGPLILRGLAVRAAALRQFEVRREADEKARR